MTVSLASTSEMPVFEKYRLYSKLCRVIAWCHRFRHCFTPNKKTSPLEVDEINHAEKTIIKWIQYQNFLFKLRHLQEGSELPRNSPLKSLAPFLDEENLFRVGGRLPHAEINDEQKHQPILPANEHVTGLIMRHHHEQSHHCPPEQLLYTVRQRYWPIAGCREAQKTVRRCLNCFRYRLIIPEVAMGELPADRVRGPTRAFAVTGVDYAGPIQVRESRRRGRIHVYKAYVAVFACFHTKAVHQELVTDLSTESIIAALNRFTARRGLCANIHSDNGTNVVGASRELRELYEFLEKNEPSITTTLSEQKITCSFIPPRSPHFGSLWDAAVKIMKRLLYTVTQDKVYTYEEYYTLLTGIGAVLNSRRFTPLTNDPSDLQPLTPAQFLIGSLLNLPIQKNYLEAANNLTLATHAKAPAVLLESLAA